MTRARAAKSCRAEKALAPTWTLVVCWSQDYPCREACTSDSRLQLGVLIFCALWYIFVSPKWRARYSKPSSAKQLGSVRAHPEPPAGYQGTCLACGAGGRLLLAQELGRIGFTLGKTMAPTWERDSGLFLQSIGEASQGKNLSSWSEVPRVPQVEPGVQSIGGQMYSNLSTYLRLAVKGQIDCSDLQEAEGNL